MSLGSCKENPPLRNLEWIAIHILVAYRSPPITKMWKT